MDRQIFECLNFEEIKTIVDEDRLELLGRSHRQQEQYEDFCRGIRALWISVSDYLIASKFNTEVYFNIEGKKCVKRPITNCDGIVLVLNDFPYNFEAGIQHYILWKMGGPVTKQNILDSIESLRQSKVNFTDYVYYINPPHLKSIPDIEHAHIIIR
mmetsp:Transcript_15627/g.21424  ORF Transcript_15627/g.21424 Transcript_15627/m.21424 type:complete len:156 (-) Transcript_15627:90-557(-)